MSIAFKSEKDKWVKCISSSGTIRAIAISATEIVNVMAKRHALSEIATIALAEATISGLILSSYCKDGEKVNLNIKGSGWAKHAIIDANAQAEVRGYIVERDQKEVQLAKNVGPWGIGLLSVLRTKREEDQPYIGTVPLLTGRLAKDLTFYWLQSEQVQSAVGLEVFMNKDGTVALAEGFLIQALPGATDSDIQWIEDQLKELPSFDLEATPRKTPLNLLSFLLSNQSFSILEETNLTFRCECSVERVKRSLALIGADELQDMLKENKDVEIVCDFCSEKYNFKPSMIEELLKTNS
jgi:molecular chaperone Hsp33